MAKDNNSFHETVNSLFQGMDGMITSKTVVGEAVTCLLYTSRLTAS